MIVWLNGDLKENTNARIAPDDRGFLLGDGIFETILVRIGRPVFFDKHIARLNEGARILGFEVPYSANAISAAIEDLLGANQLTNEPHTALRLTLTRGSGPRGLAPPENPKPTMLIACFQSAQPPQSATAITSRICRNELSPTACFKALPYLDQILAKREAQAAGVDDALLLNSRGKVVCATAANLFLWDSNTLITPPIKDGCLNGITRQAVIQLAKENNIGCFEESIAPSTLTSVESGFLTNSLAGMQTLSAIDGRVLTEHKLMPSLREALSNAEQNSNRR
jgi:branched-chain amino acid aminotransferase